MEGMKKRKWAWVTIAEDTATAMDAIILAKSLTRTLTEADLIIFVDNGISEILKDFLSTVYNAVIPLVLDTSHPKSFSKIDFAKLFSWTLGMYNKCIVLNSSHLVLKNCDELFLMEPNTAALFDQVSKNENCNLPIFIMKPCYSVYKSITKYAASGNYQNLGDILNSCFTNGNSSAHSSFWISAIPEFCYYDMSINDELATDSIKIINCSRIWSVNETKKGNRKSMSSFMNHNKFIYDTWLSVFEEIGAQLGPELVLEFQSTHSLTPMASIKRGENGGLARTRSNINKSIDYKDGIAVIGHSCRFPGANSVDEFWELIVNGGDGICQVPAERLFDHQLDDSRYTDSKGGFLKCPIDEFDAKFFGISPREAAYMDPQQRLLVEVAWEALENAAIDPHSLKGSNTGVFTGVWTHDYERLINDNTTGQDFHHVVLGNAFSATSARVSYFLGLNGPNIATESGCSSSMVGLHLACESLLRKETNLALVLGANIIIMQFPFSEIPILAKDGHCKTFCEKADGFGRSEGAAVIVLKRLADAIRDNDRIMGIIRGSAMSNEGTTSSFGTPSKLCQEIAVKDALKNAKVCPNDVDYVEAHGTGTPIGDPIEFAAISSGYNNNSIEKRSAPLVIGSVKTNIGHTESAAGLAGLIKVLLSMKHEVIPPHINFEALNPNINLNSLPAIIPMEAYQWPRNEERVRIAGVSSFGISGTNVHAVIEEPPFSRRTINQEECKDRSHHILTLSAKSENALKDLTSKYIKHFEENSNLDMGDMSFTANTGRAHLKNRIFVVGSNINSITSELVNNANMQTPQITTTPKIAFLFTGQGSQYFGMAKILYESNLTFRNNFSQVARIVQKRIEISLLDALWSDASTINLDQSIYSQTCIFAVEFALLKMWESFGVAPDYVLGHSVGEFASAVAAGILELEDAIILVTERSRLIHNLPSGGMLAVRLSKQKVSQLIADFLKLQNNTWLDIAVVNSQDEVVVAGDKKTIQLFQEFICLKNKSKCQLLAASHAFHSRAMNEILEPFGEIASKIYFYPPKCKYVSGTTGRILYEVGNETVDAFYWQRHAREPVNFPSGIKTLHDEGCNIFIEIGAHPVLLALGQVNLPSVENSLWLPSIRRNEDNWETILKSVGNLYMNGFDIKWKSIDSAFQRQKVELPTYPFQRQKYWIECKSERPTKILHPLLGRQLAIAGVDDKVFEHTWNLKDLSYLHDHQVANVTILPASGFLEIILAAGKASMAECKENCPGILKVTDFVVESPLELQEGGSRPKIQVVSTPSKDNLDSQMIKVYAYQNVKGYNEEKGWKQYSSACVSATNTKGDDDKLLEAEVISEIKSRCPVEKSTADFYKVAPEIGIYFGDTFQSIETVWKGTNEVLGGIPLPKNAGNLTDYIYHPIVLDAMIQTFGLSIAQELADLYLPIAIEKFVVINQSESSYFYAHAQWKQGKINATVKLYNEKNTLLAVMLGVRLVRTSISSFLNVINSQKNVLPGMFVDTWRLRSRKAPLQSRVNLTNIKNAKEHLEELTREMSVPMELLSKYPVGDTGEKLCASHILKIFNGIGWKPIVGCRYNLRSVMRDAMISECHSGLMRRYFEILQEEGYLSICDSDKLYQGEWKLVKTFPTIEEIVETEKGLHANLFSMIGKLENHTISYISILGGKYTLDVIRGNISALSVLFGDIDKELNSLRVYTEGIEVLTANKRISNYLTIAFRESKSESQIANSVLRILEIGAGSGSTSKEIISSLKAAGIAFQYTFTDISPHFLDEAKKQFSGYSNVDYKLLNIEKDPLTQGFAPLYYDVVIAANVVHATEYLRVSVANIRTLLSLSGLFFLQELLGPKRSVDIIFGIVEGYWRFKDFDLRPFHPCVTQDVWDRVLLECNFSASTLLSESHELTSVLVSRAVDFPTLTQLETESDKKLSWIIISDEGNISEYLHTKLTHVGRHVQLVKCKNMKEIIDYDDSLEVQYLDLCNYSVVENYFSNFYKNHNVEGIIYLCGLNDSGCKYNQKNFLHPALNICKTLVANTLVKTRVYVATRGIYAIGDQGIVNPSKATLWALTKSTMNELPELFAKNIDLDPDSNDDLHSDSCEIFYELFAGQDKLVCYRNRRKFVNRVTKFSSSVAPITLPKGRYTITIPMTKKIQDVGFKAVGKATLGSNDVEILVKATALNFRDIFVILKPDMFKSLFDAVGTDFSGIVSDVGSNVSKYKIGDEVFGISNASSAASHVVVNSGMISPKPKHFTYCDACTLPSVFLTAYYCLVTTANLKAGESILIHVASGGVGLIAIQIAKHIGANIFATAGSKRKRRYLRSLGLAHVFHSRDLSFGDEISKATSGRGVNMVLNSLTGSGFKETSLKVCASHARFVEMGKVNIWQPEDVKELRPDVQYTIVDLEKVQGNEMSALVGKMTHFFEKDIFTPLPYSRFELVQIKEALNYFLKAQHIGKVVVAMPEMVESYGQTFTNELIFNYNATYLVTGGLGGIGLEVTKWMADSGAKNLVVVGRSAPDAKAKQILTNLRSKGCQILAMQVDIGDINQCENLFQTMREKLPRLRGVIHSAGAISDGMLRNQTWEKFELVFRAKVQGGWNLHNLTKNMDLEHFVLFSSMVALWSPMGQSNHGAGNMFLDSLAHYRHSKGLPAQTINWGSWSQVGAATNTAFGNEGAFGIKPFTPTQGISSLKYIMTHPNITQIGVINLDVATFKVYFEQFNRSFLELAEEKCLPASESFTAVQSDTFWSEITNQSLEERILYVKNLLQTIIRQTLKIPESEKLDEYQTFNEMGLDSLMAVEMRNKLQFIVGKKLTLNASSLLDHPTMNSLSKYLAEMTMTLNSSLDDNAISPNISTESALETESLIKQDCNLPITMNAKTNSVKPSEITNVLLTGSTGHLGVYILKDLMLNSNLNVYCLIKGKSIQNAKSKLLANLKKFELDQMVNLERVHIVVGNIVQERLGISESEYEKLSHTIDAIFHLAVKANHVEKYKISQSNVDIRSVNVCGTVNVLNFAGNVKTKRVFYTTSYTTVNRFLPEGYVDEQFPDDDNFGDGINYGYGLSKFVGEKLLKKANDVGIPCTVIRYPTLVGNSVTGHFTVDTNFMLNLFFISCRMGVFPKFIGGWITLPIDVASKMTIQLCLNDNTEVGVYNLIPPVPIYANDFVEIANKFGVALKLSNNEEFEAFLARESKDNAYLLLFTEVYRIDNFRTMFLSSFPVSKIKDNSDKLIYKPSDKLLKVLPNFLEEIPHIKTLMELYMNFSKNNGILDKFGVKMSS